jgi:hypothetical protein
MFRLAKEVGTLLWFAARRIAETTIKCAGKNKARFELA